MLMSFCYLQRKTKHVTSIEIIQSITLSDEHVVGIFLLLMSAQDDERE